MSDTGSNCDKPQQEDANLEESQSEAVTIPEAENKPVTPVKRTPKRLSAVERAQRESEELVKTLGGSLDIEGGRKTRSSTRGTPSKSNVINTPPPSKKARATSGTPKRGRGRKLETTIEDEVKTSPEKVSSDLEAVKEVNEENKSSTEEAAPTDENPEDAKCEAIETPSAVAVAEEEKSPSVKEDDKPEPMEVDGVSKDTATELEKADDESSQNKVDSLEKPIEDEPDNVVDETVESSSAPEEAAADPPASAEEDKNSLSEKEIEENAHVNNLKENDTKVNSNSIWTEASLPNQTPATPATPASPATPVSVAGNEHKTESNDLCEPKIASPPIAANNEGATPQYCN